MGQLGQISRNIFSDRRSSLVALMIVFFLFIFDRYQPIFLAWTAFMDEGKVLPMILQLNSFAYLITFGILIIIAAIWKLQYMWLTFLAGTLLLIPRLVAVHLGFFDDLSVDLVVAYFEFFTLGALLIVTLLMYRKLREVDDLIQPDP